MKKLLFLFILLWTSAAQATIHNCASPSYADVKAKTDIAIDGDTVVIPPGSATWTSKFLITKNIILTGGSMFDGSNKTTITIDVTNGTVLDFITNDNGATATVKNIAFLSTNAGANIIKMRGTARKRKISATSWGGGFRITNCRFGLTSPTENLASQFLILQDWVTGTMDHCWVDFAATNTGGTGIIDVSQASAPGYVSGTAPIVEGGNTYIPLMGQNSYAREYKWGAGPGDRPTGNGDWDAFVIEDNIFCKVGIGITSTDIGSTSNGGGRMVVRYNALWCTTGGHNFGGSGGDASGYVTECYNNYFRTPISTSFRPHNLRGGAHVFFNERYEGAWGNPTGIAGVQMDRLQWASSTGAMVGVTDGTNFFDKNHRDTLCIDANHISVPCGTTEIYTFTPAVTQNSDTRIGAIYKTGTHSHPKATGGNGNYTLEQLDPNCPAGKYIGFVVRNADASCTESSGGQCNDKPRGANMMIGTSSAGNAAGDVDITLAAGSGFSPLAPGWFSLTDGETWELRWVDQILGATGGTLVPTMNGGNHAGSLYPNFLTAVGGNNQYWCNQRPDGDWAWDIKWRALNGSTWTDCAYNLSGVLDRLVLGGKHNCVRDIANAGWADQAHTIPSGPANVTYNYPRPAVDVLRIGPDWDSGTFGAPVNPDTAAETYGSTYPDPFVSATITTGPHIAISGDLAYGDTIIGTSAVRTVTISNDGDDILNVTSVAYTPSVFSGSTDSFSVSPGNTFTVDVTFGPVAETHYTGTVTFTSNATSGGNTISANGDGVPGAERDYNVYRIIKRVLSKWMP